MRWSWIEVITKATSISVTVDEFKCTDLSQKVTLRSSWEGVIYNYVA